MALLDDNFLLKNDMAVKLFNDYAKDMPIIDFHCHLNPEEIYENKNYPNITRIWINEDHYGDHYKWRLMRANGVPEELIEDYATNSAICIPTMMPYITAFFMPRRKEDRPDVIVKDAINFAFLGQFAHTPRDTVFTTEYSVRTAMEAVYGLLGVDRGVPEVWGSVYDIRELLDSSVKLMDGKSPLEMNLGPLNIIKKPLIRSIKGTVIEKLLKEHQILKENEK